MRNPCLKCYIQKKLKANSQPPTANRQQPTANRRQLMLFLIQLFMHSLLHLLLSMLWLNYGNHGELQPDVVLGHSLGEYIAACVAGVFTLEDGLKLVASHAGL